jgi:acetyl esterase/lipase
LEAFMAEPQTGRVTIEEGVVFGTGGGRDLKCDVYNPPQSGPNRPGVLLVHGGGWMQGDRTQLRGYGILLGRLGYVCVATEYRLTGESKWPAQIHDVKACLRWMRANADRLGIDPDKIAVSGNSAGGHLSLMIAGTQNMPEFEGDGGNPGVSTSVAACIAFYAPVRLAELYERRKDAMLPQLFAADATRATHEAASPITHAANNFPPTCLIHGNKDELVSYRESLHMYDALMAAGARAELHMYDGVPHGFDALPDFGRQCAAIMALFLDRNVANPRAITLPQAATA